MEKMGTKGKDINISREWAKFWIGIALTFVGVMLVIASFALPPLGIIHSSVIEVFGLMIGFVGAIFGIDSHAKIRIHDQDVDYEIRNKELEHQMEIRTMELEQKMKMWEKKHKLEEEDLE